MEKNIEAHLRSGAKRRGAMLLKFVSPQNSGVPDRMLLHPALRRPTFVELKDTGKTPTELQTEIHRLLREHGADVFIVDSKSGADELLEKLFGPKTGAEDIL